MAESNSPSSRFVSLTPAKKAYLDILMNKNKAKFADLIII